MKLINSEILKKNIEINTYKLKIKNKWTNQLIIINNFPVVFQYLQCSTTYYVEIDNKKLYLIDLSLNFFFIFVYPICSFNDIIL